MPGNQLTFRTAPAGCHGSRPARIDRPGSSLMEMVLLMSMIGIILLISIQLMRRAIAVHQVAIASVIDVRVSEAIEQRLRSDLSRCQSASIDASALVLTIDDRQSIQYDVPQKDSQELVRRVVALDQPEKADRWLLPHPFVLTMTSEASPSERMLVRVGVKATNRKRDGREVSLEVVGSCDARK